MSNRLVEHQYDGVSIDTTLTLPDNMPEPCGIYTSDLWAEAYIEVLPTLSEKLVWMAIGKAGTPSGDQVISGCFYAQPHEVSDGSVHNPEMFVKIYIAKNGWANIAFNHVTIYNIQIYSAHHFNGKADQVGTISLTNRLVQHQYGGVVTDVGQETDDVTVSVNGNGTVLPSLFGGAKNPSECIISVPHGGSQSYSINPGTNYHVKDVRVGGTSVGDGICLYHYTLLNVTEPIDLGVVFGKSIVGGHPLGSLNAADVYVSGNYAYVVTNESGFFNIADPANPTVASTLDGTLSGKVYVSGHHAYVADGKLLVMDITNPSSPTFVGRLGGTPFAKIDASGNYAYVSDFDRGLLALDITDPIRPAMVGRADTGGVAYDLHVSGAYLYMRGDMRFCVFDITDPAYPIAIGCVTKGNYRRQEFITSASASGHYAYICDREDGLSVVDLNVCGLK